MNLWEWKKTKVGRVVYPKKLKLFTAKDAFRIIRHLPLEPVRAKQVEDKEQQAALDRLLQNLFLDAILRLAWILIRSFPQLWFVVGMIEAAIETVWMTPEQKTARMIQAYKELGLPIPIEYVVQDASVPVPMY